MPDRQRVAQYIRQLAYQTLFKREERDDRPDDAPPGVAEFKNKNWTATSFAEYAPYRSPQT